MSFDQHTLKPAPPHPDPLPRSGSEGKLDKGGEGNMGSGAVIRQGVKPGYAPGTITDQAAGQLAAAASGREAR